MIDKEKEVVEFSNSMRGRYIIGQALYLAIESINARPRMKQEPSNVADMEFLMDNLFPIYKMTQMAITASVERIKQKEDSK